MRLRHFLENPQPLGLSLTIGGLILFLTSWMIFPLNESLHSFHQFFDVIMFYLAAMIAALVLTLSGIALWTYHAIRKQQKRGYMMIETSKIEVAKLLEVAENAAHEAGGYLVEKLGQAKIKDQKSSRDDLLDVDLGAENIILTTLRNTTSAIGILSEEAGLDGSEEDYWIIDPLDGSANFQHGNPTFSIAIALVINHVTVAGVIYLPIRNETFTAIQGQGAYLNGKPIRVSQIKTFEEAIVHTGDVMKEGKPDISRERMEDISKLFIHARRVRMIGTAATDLAYVACGRAEMLVNHARKPWDIEAGKLLVLEAGGKVTSKQTGGNSVLSIYSNGTIHKAAEDLLF